MKAMGKKILIGIVTLLFLVTGLFLFYVNDDYDASEEARMALVSTEEVQVAGEDPIQFRANESNQSEVGIIFYPGGKVETEAYAPLMQQLAQAGYAVFLAEMPFGLAVFDINAADEIIDENPEISKWYLAGHSLGGSMAAIFASQTTKELAGLILLAAYSTADLSESGIPVLGIFGSEDQVIDSEKVAEYRTMLPESHVERVIEGGNHAQFGDYGKQAGDGESSISTLEQQQMIVDEISNFIR